jgi:hypothetical protein
MLTMTVNDINTMTRAELKTWLSDLGIADKKGSKNILKTKIKHKLEEDIINELKNNLESTGQILYPEANEVKQNGNYRINGIYTYRHNDSSVPDRLTAAKIGYTSFEAEKRSLQSLILDRDSFLIKNFNYTPLPTYPE